MVFAKIKSKYNIIIKLLLVLVVFAIIFCMNDRAFKISSIIYYVLTVVILLYDDLIKTKNEIS